MVKISRYHEGKQIINLQKRKDSCPIRVGSRLQPESTENANGLFIYWYEHNDAYFHTNRVVALRLQIALGVCEEFSTYLR